MTRSFFTPLAALVFLLTGCKTPAPNYHFNAAIDDPEISFESAFDLHTYFSVNIKAPAENKCADFDRAGYMLKKDSIFLYDKANTDIRIKAPANMPMAVTAHHSYSDPAHSTNCGPLTRIFTPEKNTNYIVKLNTGDAPVATGSKRICYLSVESVASNGRSAEIPSQPLPKCTQ